MMYAILALISFSFGFSAGLVLGAWFATRERQ